MKGVTTSKIFQTGKFSITNNAGGLQRNIKQIVQNEEEKNRKERVKYLKFRAESDDIIAIGMDPIKWTIK